MILFLFLIEFILDLGGNRWVWYDNLGFLDEEVGDCVCELLCGMV